MNLTQFVLDVENQLGYQPPPGQPLWRARVTDAAKLKRKIASKPQLYSDENLAAALEWCRINKIEVKSPLGVLNFVHLATTRTQVINARTTLDEQISEALGWERERGDVLSEIWIRRLTRAEGSARDAVYQEWQRDRRT